MSARSDNALRSRIRQILQQQVGYGAYAGVYAGKRKAAPKRRMAAGRVPAEVAHRDRQHGQMRSPWMAFLHEFWEDHPGMSYKEAMIKAGPIYRRQHGLVSKTGMGYRKAPARRRVAAKRKGGVVIGAAKSKKAEFLNLAKKLIKMAGK